MLKIAIQKTNFNDITAMYDLLWNKEVGYDAGKDLTIELSTTRYSGIDRLEKIKHRYDIVNHQLIIWDAQLFNEDEVVFVKQLTENDENKNIVLIYDESEN